MSNGREHGPGCLDMLLAFTLVSVMVFCAVMVLANLVARINRVEKRLQLKPCVFAIPDTRCPE